MDMSWKSRSEKNQENITFILHITKSSELDFKSGRKLFFFAFAFKSK